MNKSRGHVFGLVVLVSIVSLLTGCLTAPFVPPPGAAFTQFSAPLDVDFQNTDMAAMRKGSAEAISILGLFAFGDASSKAAAESANISKIVHADYDYFNILGIFQKTTVVVYGK